MLLKTIRKFLKKFHLFGCHQKKNDEFPANQSTVPRPWPHTDEPRQQKVTMSSLNSNWVNISYWQQQQYCGYIFTGPIVTPRQETPSSTRRTGKIWSGQECLETQDQENCFHWHAMSGVRDVEMNLAIFAWSFRLVHMIPGDVIAAETWPLCNKMWQMCSHYGRCQTEVTLIGSGIFTARC